MQESNKLKWRRDIMTKCLLKRYDILCFAYFVFKTIQGVCICSYCTDLEFNSFKNLNSMTCNVPNKLFFMFNGKYTLITLMLVHSLKTDIYKKIHKHFEQ